MKGDEPPPVRFDSVRPVGDEVAEGGLAGPVPALTVADGAFLRPLAGPAGRTEGYERRNGVPRMCACVGECTDNGRRGRRGGGRRWQSLTAADAELGRPVCRHRFATKRTELGHPCTGERELDSISDQTANSLRTKNAIEFDFKNRASRQAWKRANQRGPTSLFTARSWLRFRSSHKNEEHVAVVVFVRNAIFVNNLLWLVCD